MLQVITPSLPQTGEQTPAHKFMFRSNLIIVMVGIESIIVYAFGSDFHLQDGQKEPLLDDSAQGTQSEESSAVQSSSVDDSVPGSCADSLITAAQEFCCNSLIR
eukprot:SAG25_NODE_20_length_23237_cov_58.179229_27_plen_104_part_00